MLACTDVVIVQSVGENEILILGVERHILMSLFSFKLLNIKPSSSADLSPS